MPISNLSYIFKLVELVLDSQFEIHMVENDLTDPMQSAYWKYHSADTASVKMHNDTLEAVDGGSCVIFALLDLSAAFDTVDHEILQHRLEKNWECLTQNYYSSSLI